LVSESEPEILKLHRIFYLFAAIRTVSRWFSSIFSLLGRSGNPQLRWQWWKHWRQEEAHCLGMLLRPRG